MQTKIKIAILDDNPDLRQILNSYIATQGDMEIVGMAGNGLGGIELIESTCPDVVILDMIMPHLDGLGVMEHITKTEAKSIPSFICLSAVGQEDLIRMAVNLGAKYYMVKPFDVEVLIRRIRELMKGSDADGLNMPSNLRTENIEEKISKVFLAIGIPAHIKGYHFLREAIKMVVEDSDIINRITKELYPGIAEKFNTTPSKVERAIRHAIDVAWNRGRIENINRLFGYVVYSKNDKPTNGEFIALVADKLSMEQPA